MKKIFALLAVIPILCLCSCGRSQLKNNAEVEYSTENGHEVVDAIYGRFSDTVVSGADDAAAVLAEISGIIGLDKNNELEFTGILKDTDTAYSFRQVYNGIPVHDRRIVLYTSAETGEISGLSGSCYPFSNFSTKAKLSAGEAADIVKEKTKCGINGEPELSISLDSADKPVLVWVVGTSGGNTAYSVVDAATGRICCSEPSNIE